MSSTLSRVSFLRWITKKYRKNCYYKKPSVFKLVKLIQRNSIILKSKYLSSAPKWEHSIVMILNFKPLSIHIHVYQFIFYACYVHVILLICQLFYWTLQVCNIILYLLYFAFQWIVKLKHNKLNWME